MSGAQPMVADRDAPGPSGAACYAKRPAGSSRAPAPAPCAFTAEPTEAITNGIAREDLLAWHKRYWGANNAILVVAGDFQKADMLKKLEATFGKWRAAEKAVPKYPKVQQA
ncbi:MAG: insulinase family protein, partial [Acidobacteria bacterium]